MSYRHDKQHKASKGLTGLQMWALQYRDLRFCQRWGIAEDRAYLWARHPGHPPIGIMQILVPTQRKAD